ncbi:hypothetical protein JCM8097_006307 [Rhodosporidiobolus ruineniae]
MPASASKRTTRGASTPKSSPRKPSAKAKGKRKASTTTTPSSARTGQQAQDGEGEDDEDDDFGDENTELQQGESFVTASAGDAYLLYSTQPSRTSDALLSTAIDPAFTLSSYTSALRTFDSLDLPAFQAHRDLSAGRVQKAQDRFPRWLWELDQGFNLLLHGLGSKRTVLNAFAERARRKGNVVVVNGFDTAAAVGDLLTALEDLVRLQGGMQDDEDDLLDEASTSTPRKRKRGAAASAASTPSKKSKAAASAAAAKKAASSSYGGARPVSALESRARRLCASLRAAKLANPVFKPIYLVLHSLDSPALRVPKVVALLALLAAQKDVHLLASVDHVRSSLLFPTALATARPPSLSASAGSYKAEASDLADLALTFRAFTFLHYDVSTLLPYDTEVTSLGTLSSLLPPSIYPPLSASLDPTASSLAQSATHVLASVTDRARRLFNMLGQEQVRVAEGCPREVERAMRLDGGTAGREGEKAPVVAMTLNSLKEKATDALIATHPDQVDGFLAEFRDHGVVRSCTVAPEIVEGVNDDEEEEREEGAEWVWIPLAREALEEVLEELGIEE